MEWIPVALYCLIFAGIALFAVRNEGKRLVREQLLRDLLVLRLYEFNLQTADELTELVNAELSRGDGGPFAANEINMELHNMQDRGEVKLEWIPAKNQAGWRLARKEEKMITEG